MKLITALFGLALLLPAVFAQQQQFPTDDKTGRAIGVTDSVGSGVTDYGWSANRDVRPEDVTSTIYSALGIDYTIVRHDDPLNRGFEYVPFAKDGVYKPIDELW